MEGHTGGSEGIGKVLDFSLVTGLSGIDYIVLHDEHTCYVHPLYVSTLIKIFKSLKQRAEETELSESAGDTGSGRSLVSTGEARTLASAKPSSLLHQPNFQPSWQGLRQGGRA